MNIVTAKLSGRNAPHDFDLGSHEAKVGDFLVVEGEKGMVLAEVCGDLRQDEDRKSRLPKVLRIAGRDDLEKSTKYKGLEAETFLKCKEIIKRRRMPMKLLAVEYIFDGSKIIFYFTAEGRVDFRDMVRELAHLYRTRIELLQIGVRDAAKKLTGVGVCGRELCCSSFLRGFTPVSIKMAKDQNLSLNPSKVAGVCGRLMCCLSYEHELYREFSKGLPKVGKRCVCPGGCGKVSRHDPLAGKIYVWLEEKGMEAAFDPGEVERIMPPGQEKVEEGQVQKAGS